MPGLSGQGEFNMTRAHERGSAMIIATILVLALAATSVALLTEVAYTQKRTKESLDGDEGYVIARAGLERARRALYVYRTSANWSPLLGADGQAQWSNILLFNNPNQVVIGNRVFDTNAVDFIARVRQNYFIRRTEADFVAYRSDPYAPGAGTTPEAPDFTSGLVMFGQATPFRTGGFHVALRNNASDPGGPLADTDRTLVATVTSVLDDGTVRRLEADLYYEEGVFDPNNALLTNGSMEISGDPKIQGLKGSVHANDDLLINGNPAIEDNATAGDQVTITGGSATVGGTTASGQPKIEIPPIKPSDFFDDRDYYFRSDGRIFNKLGVMVGNGSGNGWHGIKFAPGSPPKWDMGQPGGDGLPPPGTFYFEGSLVIGSNIGNQASDPPLQVTFITTYSLEISGNPGITPYLQDVQAIAGTDLKINGNPDLDTYQGFWGAHEQVMISGNPNIFGAVVAENAASLDGTVAPASGVGMVINGNPVITFNGGLRTMLSVPPSVEIVQLRLIR
jgi:hypothetical protein